MIVITTPTGDIGHQLVEMLLADGTEPLRVIARDPARLPAAVREGAEVVTGSHGDAAVIDAALTGADSLFWVVPPDFTVEDAFAQYRDFTLPACAAIGRRGVERVVVVSALGRGVPGNAGLVSASLQMVDLIGATGVSYRALAMPGFMENTLRQLDAIRDAGTLFGTIRGSLKLRVSATRDIAAVAARLLLDHSWSGQADLPVLGAEDLSFDEMATIIGEVLGKPVRYQQVPFKAFREQMVEQGASPGFAQAMVDMMIAKDNGLDNHAERTPESTTPTSFRQWCEEVLKPAIAG
jgi:uncharacterized protein YbjT (DUF2867 family)